jgi:hypothetical protein
LSCAIKIWRRHLWKALVRLVRPETCMPKRLTTHSAVARKGSNPTMFGAPLTCPWRFPAGQPHQAFCGTSSAAGLERQLASPPQQRLAAGTPGARFARVVSLLRSSAAGKTRPAV